MRSRKATAPPGHFERCEAALPDGSRCRYRLSASVKNPGAYLPYRVCRVHKRQGDRALRLSGAVPDVWTDFWRRWHLCGRSN